MWVQSQETSHSGWKHAAIILKLFKIPISMSLKNCKLLLMLFFLCNSRCAKDGTNFHFFNRSKHNILVLSKSELYGYENNLITKKYLNSKIIEKESDLYVAIEKADLSAFMDKKNNITFYIVSKQNVDSIVIINSKIDFDKDENCIYYDKNFINFSNNN